MRFSFPYMGVVFATLVLIAGLSAVGSAQPPAKELTPEQKAKLKESRQYSKESSALEKEGKLIEAIAAAEKMLAIERSLFGDVHEDVIGSLKRLARMHERLEDFAAAQKERREVLALQIKLRGEKTWQVADARLDLQHLETLLRLDANGRQELKESDQLMTRAIAHNKPGKHREGAEFAERALAIRLRLLKDDSPLTAFSAAEAGVLWERANQFDKARLRYEQALIIYQKGCGELHPSSALVLEDLGCVALNQMEYAQASEWFARSLAIRQKVLGDSHFTTTGFVAFLDGQIGFLASQARQEEQKDNLAAAIKIRDGIVILQTRRYGKNHYRVTDARLDLQYVNTLSQLDLKARQELRAADAWLRQAAAQITSGDPNFVMGAAGKALAIRAHLSEQGTQPSASSAMGAGPFKEVRGNLEKALIIQKKVLGDDHPRTATTFNNLGSLLYRQGDYAAARPCYERALATRKQALGEDHPDTATCLNNLGALADCQGDYADAGPYYERALTIQKMLFGEDHPATFLTLNNLGALRSNQKDFAGARIYFDQALTISKKKDGGNNPRTALALNNLGTLLAAQEDYTAARAYFEQALAINKKFYGEDDPDTAFSLNNLGVLLYQQGDYAGARPYFEKTLDLRRRLLGNQHPDTGFSLNNLGTLLAHQGNVDAARLHLEEALAISRRSLDLAAAAQSERQQLLMGTRQRYQFANFLNLPCETELHITSTYGHVLAWKGSVLARQLQLRLERQNPELAKWVAALRHTASELATIAFATPNPGDRDLWNRDLEVLTRRQESLERELAQKSQNFRKNQEMQNLTARQLLHLLPAEAALVDFLVYRSTQSDPDKKGHRISEDHLTAFILKPGTAIVRLELGPMQPIEKAIQLWRGRTKDRTLAAKDHPGMELRRRVWLPLEKHLAGAKIVFISPDGALGRLPFAALPGSKEGTYLLEDVALTVVPVPRLLPELLDKDNKHNPGKETSLLLVGDIDFDASPGKASAEGRAAAAGERNGMHKVWKRLPGTKGEILVIRDSFEQRFADSKLKVLRGEQATQSSLRELAPKYSHLHLATHGFFAPPSVRSALAINDKERSSSNLFDKQGVSGFHPGLLSGLVFAGANNPPEPGQSDGILTALEVAELDLSKVELAVLSACETGLGKVAAGEGLLGLQRAFQVAGARSVVASLWTVDDEATRKLMERFYENHWQKKLSKAQALRQAQLSMLRGELVRGLLLDEEKNNPRLPPYYWAAFVLSGDWR